MKRKIFVSAIMALLAAAFCACGSSTTMDLEYLQEEAYQKGYEQGIADASEENSAEGDFDSGYSKGYEEGYADGYSEGSKTSESEESESSKSEDSSSVSEGVVCDYVLTTNSKKFHSPDCSSVGDIKEKNKEYFTGTREEIIAEGYEPCGRCSP